MNFRLTFKYNSLNRYFFVFLIFERQLDTQNVK